MASEVKLPRLGQGMESGTVTKWLKNEGDAVEKGEPLFEVDTDKVTQEVESDFAGVLLKIALPRARRRSGRRSRGSGRPGRRSPAEAGAGAAARSGSDSGPASRECLTPPRRRHAPTRATRRVKASPLARRLARERGIDIASLQGTGPDGRIVAEGRRGRAGAPGRAGARFRRGEVEKHPADEHPQDDRAPAHRRVAGAGVPADGHRRHDARERARRARARAEPRRAHHRHRPARESVRPGADASPRRECPVHGGRAPPLPDRERRDRGRRAAGPRRSRAPSVERLSLAEVAAPAATWSAARATAS